MCARNILLYVPHSCPCPCSGLWQYAKYTESVDNSKNTDRKHKQCGQRGRAELQSSCREKQFSALNTLHDKVGKLNLHI